VTRFEQTASDVSSDVVGTYTTYCKFLDVAEKNRVDKEDEFKQASRTAVVKRKADVIDEGNYMKT
jgi:hypothetical protein